MRLQGGPLHVGWRGREHLVYVRATFRGGRRCAWNSLGPVPLPKSPHLSSPLLYHPTFEAVATRGQSQHSGQSQPWLLFSHEVGRTLR